jgi:U2-associated protein SR140
MCRIVFTQEVSDQLRALLDGNLTLEQIDAAKRAQDVAAVAEDGPDKKDRRNREEESAGKGFKTSGFKSSFKRIGNLEQQAEDLLNEALGGSAQASAAGENVDGEAMDEEELDGEAMDGDIDGEEMDIDGEEMEDLDGEEMEDLDGEAMDDLDGEEM